MERCQLHKGITSIGTNYYLSEPSSLKDSRQKGQKENEPPLTPSGVVFGFWPCREQGLMGNRPFRLSALRLHVSWEIYLWLTSPQLMRWLNWRQSSVWSGFRPCPSFPGILVSPPQPSLPTSSGFSLHMVLGKEVTAGLPWWSSGPDSMLPMKEGPGSIPSGGTRSHIPQLKAPTCHNEDQRSHVPQQRPGATK